MSITLRSLLLTVTTGPPPAVPPLGITALTQRTEPDRDRSAVLWSFIVPELGIPPFGAFAYSFQPDRLEALPSQLWHIILPEPPVPPIGSQFIGLAVKLDDLVSHLWHTILPLPAEEPPLGSSLLARRMELDATPWAQLLYPGPVPADFVPPVVGGEASYIPTWRTRRR